MDKQRLHQIIGELDDTDNSLMELTDVIQMISQGVRDSVDGRTMENVLIHILTSLRDICAQLDEVTAAVVRLGETPAA